MQANILLVLSDNSPQQLIALNLHRAGHRVERLRDAESAWCRIDQHLPDMVLTDWTLPGMSGVELARRLREHPPTRRLGIILMSASAGERDRVTALDGGADDFVANPSSVRELLARVAAVLRRRAPHLDATVLRVGTLLLDPATRSVRANGQMIALGPREYPMLMFLMGHSERVHSRERLIDAISPQESGLDARAVDARVARIRAALRPHGLDGMLQTVRGSGYCLSERKP